MACDSGIQNTVINGVEGAAVKLHLFGAMPYDALVAVPAAPLRISLKWSDPLG
jgi:hypothetical protein